MQALDKVLALLAAEQAFRVLLVHHPLHSTSRVKRLTDSRRLLALIRQHGVELVLHGHDHIHSTMWLEGPRGEIPAIGVPSASAVAHRHYPGAAFNMFSIERSNGAWRVEQTVRGIDRDMQVKEIRRVQLS
jgi:3',5'-cyclic AMP phosphodiesterase CpdA